MRQLQADIGIQPATSNFSEQLMVEFGTFMRLCRLSYIFTEVVDGNAEAGLIQLRRNLQSVFDVRAGDKAAGNTASNGGLFRNAAQPAALRKGNEERPQHRSLTKEGSSPSVR